MGAAAVLAVVVQGEGALASALGANFSEGDNPQP